MEKQAMVFGGGRRGMWYGGFSLVNPNAYPHRCLRVRTLRAHTLTASPHTRTPHPNPRVARVRSRPHQILPPYPHPHPHPTLR